MSLVRPMTARWRQMYAHVSGILLLLDTHSRCSWWAGCYGSERHGASDVSCWLVTMAAGWGNQAGVATAATGSRDNDQPGWTLETRLR